MKRFWDEKILCNIFHILASAMYLVLFGFSLWMTGVQSSDIKDEFIYMQRDSLAGNLFRIAVAIIVLYCIGKIAEKLQTMRARNLLLVGTCLMAGVIGVYWVVGLNALPMADQFYLCQYAEAFNTGDYSGLAWGGYVSRYSQQLGIITMLRGYHILFGDLYVRAFQLTVALMVPFMIFAGCMIVRIVTEKNGKAEVFYLLFMLLCVPMYAYSSFVYGDLISTVFGMFGVWMFLACLKRFSYVKMVLFALFLGIAVQLRQNLLILVIAVGIVAVIKLIYKHNLHSLLMLTALLAGVLVFHLGVRGLYADVEDAPAIPALLYVVMGLNDDNGRPGWHNNYEYDTFAVCNDDVQIATDTAKAHLKMYFDIYKEDPFYMLDFFTRKMNSQWQAPMYQCLVMTAYSGEEQLSPIKEIYEYGEGVRVLEQLMKVYQMLMYGSILALLWKRRSDWKTIENYILLIAVFGGFLFSLMWEAKTRYILPFLFMQIPYMAMGMGALMELLEKWILRLREKTWNIYMKS